MKSRFLHTLGAMFAAVFRGLAITGDYVAGFFRVLFSPITALLDLLFRWLIVPAYRLMLVAQRLLGALLRPARNGMLALSAHRYLVHALVVVLVMSVGVFNVQSSTVTSEAFGDRSVFVRLLRGPVSGDEVTLEQVVDFTTEPRVAYSGAQEGALSVLSPMFLPTYSPESEQGELIVPATEHPVVPATIVGSNYVPNTKITQYTVQDGDTLWDISKTFGIDVPTLLAANNLGTRGLIRPGDVITILPVSGVLHTVKSGDTISSLAKKYAVESTDILRANQLMDSSPLKLGDSLIIPGGSTTAPVTAPSKPVTKPIAVAVAPTKTAAPVESLFAEKPKPVDVVAASEWVWPTEGKYVTQPFKGKAHTGIDIDGQIGSPNYAAHDGVVEFAGWSVGYGLSVVINHGNGLWTRYGHNSQIYVKIGDQVKAGQTIALMGTTGTSTGSHLHFEVLSGPGKFLNPLKYVKK